MNEQSAARTREAAALAAEMVGLASMDIAGEGLRMYFGPPGLAAELIAATAGLNPPGAIGWQERAPGEYVCRFAIPGVSTVRRIASDPTIFGATSEEVARWYGVQPGTVRAARHVARGADSASPTEAELRSPLSAVRSAREVTRCPEGVSLTDHLRGLMAAVDGADRALRGGG